MGREVTGIVPGFAVAAAINEGAGFGVGISAGGLPVWTLLAVAEVRVLAGSTVEHETRQQGQNDAQTQRKEGHAVMFLNNIE